MVDYNPSIPQGVDNLSTSQGQMLNNFTQLNTIFDLNHFAWNDPTAASRGLHRKIDFPATTAVVAPTSLNSVMYTRNVAGVASLYYDNAVGSSVLWRGGSNNGLITQTTGGNKSNGTMTFPNGVILKWGFQDSITNNTRVNFPVAFPSNCFSIQLTGVRTDSNQSSFWVTAGFDRTGFNVKTASGGMTGLYFAVGN